MSSPVTRVSASYTLPAASAPLVQAISDVRPSSTRETKTSAEPPFSAPTTQNELAERLATAERTGDTAELARLAPFRTIFDLHALPPRDPPRRAEEIVQARKSAKPSQLRELAHARTLAARGGRLERLMLTAEELEAFVLFNELSPTLCEVLARVKRPPENLLGLDAARYHDSVRLGLYLYHCAEQRFGAKEVKSAIARSRTDFTRVSSAFYAQQKQVAGAKARRAYAKVASIQQRLLKAKDKAAQERLRSEALEAKRKGDALVSMLASRYEEQAERARKHQRARLSDEVELHAFDYRLLAASTEIVARSAGLVKEAIVPAARDERSGEVVQASNVAALEAARGALARVEDRGAQRALDAAGRLDHLDAEAATAAIAKLPPKDAALLRTLELARVHARAAAVARFSESARTLDAAPTAESAALLASAHRSRDAELARLQADVAALERKDDERMEREAALAEMRAEVPELARTAADLQAKQQALERQTGDREWREVFAADRSKAALAHDAIARHERDLAQASHTLALAAAGGKANEADILAWREAQARKRREIAQLKLDLATDFDERERIAARDRIAAKLYVPPRDSDEARIDQAAAQLAQATADEDAAARARSKTPAQRGAAQPSGLAVASERLESLYRALAAPGAGAAEARLSLADRFAAVTLQLADQSIGVAQRDALPLTARLELGSGAIAAKQAIGEHFASRRALQKQRQLDTDDAVLRGKDSLREAERSRDVLSASIATDERLGKRANDTLWTLGTMLPALSGAKLLAEHTSYKPDRLVQIAFSTEAARADLGFVERSLAVQRTKLTALGRAAHEHERASRAAAEAEQDALLGAARDLAFFDALAGSVPVHPDHDDARARGIWLHGEQAIAMARASLGEASDAQIDAGAHLQAGIANRDMRVIAGQALRGHARLAAAAAADADRRDGTKSAQRAFARADAQARAAKDELAKLKSSTDEIRAAEAEADRVDAAVAGRREALAAYLDAERARIERHAQIARRELAHGLRDTELLRIDSMNWARELGNDLWEAAGLSSAGDAYRETFRDKEAFIRSFVGEPLAQQVAVKKVFDALVQAGDQGGAEALMAEVLGEQPRLKHAKVDELATLVKRDTRLSASLQEASRVFEPEQQLLAENQKASLVQQEVITNGALLLPSLLSGGWSLGGIGAIAGRAREVLSGANLASRALRGFEAYGLVSAEAASAPRLAKLVYTLAGAGEILGAQALQMAATEAYAAVAGTHAKSTKIASGLLGMVSLDAIARVASPLRNQLTRAQRLVAMIKPALHMSTDILVRAGIDAIGERRPEWATRLGTLWHYAFPAFVAQSGTNDRQAAIERASRERARIVTADPEAQAVVAKALAQHYLFHGTHDVQSLAQYKEEESTCIRTLQAFNAKKSSEHHIDVDGIRAHMAADWAIANAKRQLRVTPGAPLSAEQAKQVVERARIAYESAAPGSPHEALEQASQLVWLHVLARYQPGARLSNDEMFALGRLFGRKDTPNPLFMIEAVLQQGMPDAVAIAVKIYQEQRGYAQNTLADLGFHETDPHTLALTRMNVPSTLREWRVQVLAAAKAAGLSPADAIKLARRECVDLAISRSLEGLDDPKRASRVLERLDRDLASVDIPADEREHALVIAIETAGRAEALRHESFEAGASALEATVGRLAKERGVRLDPALSRERYESFAIAQKLKIGAKPEDLPPPLPVEDAKRLHFPEEAKRMIALHEHERSEAQLGGMLAAAEAYLEAKMQAGDDIGAHRQALTGYAQALRAAPASLASDDAGALVREARARAAGPFVNARAHGDPGIYWQELEATLRDLGDESAHETVAARQRERIEKTVEMALLECTAPKNEEGMQRLIGIVAEKLGGLQITPSDAVIREAIGRLMVSGAENDTLLDPSGSDAKHGVWTPPRSVPGRVIRAGSGKGWSLSEGDRSSSDGVAVERLTPPQLIRVGGKRCFLVGQVTLAKEKHWVSWDPVQQFKLLKAPIAAARPQLQVSLSEPSELAHRTAADIRDIIAQRRAAMKPMLPQLEALFDAEDVTKAVIDRFRLLGYTEVSKLDLDGAIARALDLALADEIYATRSLARLLSPDYRGPQPLDRAGKISLDLARSFVKGTIKHSAEVALGTERIAKKLNKAGEHRAHDTAELVPAVQVQKTLDRLRTASLRLLLQKSAWSDSKTLKDLSDFDLECLRLLKLTGAIHEGNLIDVRDPALQARVRQAIGRDDQALKIELYVHHLQKASAWISGLVHRSKGQSIDVGKLAPEMIGGFAREGGPELGTILLHRLAPHHQEVDSVECLVDQVNARREGGRPYRTWANTFEDIERDNGVDEESLAKLAAAGEEPSERQRLMIAVIAQQKELEAMGIFATYPERSE